MYHTNTGSYDEIPEGMMRYINNYGCHFNKKLCKEATSRMYMDINGKKEYIKPSIDKNSFPDVDIFIATYNESEEILSNTTLSFSDSVLRVGQSVSYGFNKSPFPFIYTESYMLLLV